jgi:hypothetical protein
MAMSQLRMPVDFDTARFPFVVARFPEAVTDDEMRTYLRMTAFYPSW